MKKDELVKSLQDIGFSEEEIASVVEKAGIKDEDKPSEKEETEDEKKKRLEAEEIEKKKGSEDKEKSLNIELIKSMADIFQKRSESELLKSIEAVSEENSELRKSLEALTEKVETLAKTPQPFKSFKSEDVLKKGIGEESGEDGKKVLSVSLQKDQLNKSLEEVIEKSTDAKVKSRYESVLLSFNSGGVPIPQDVAQDLFKNHNIRLVQ